MTFRPGQRVVCVKQRPWVVEHTHPEWVRRHRVVFPDKGNVLTIRVVEPPNGSSSETPSPYYLMFAEIRNPEAPTLDGIKEISFGSRWFRPLVETKTDISALTALLNTKAKDLVS